MGWVDLGTSLFSGGSGNFGDGGGGFDWGSTVANVFDGDSGGIDWGGLVTGAASSGGGGDSSWVSKIGSIFGGGDSSSGGSGGNIWQSLLAGVGTMADAKMSADAMREKGKQDRQSLDFTAALKDFYDQKDKVRKRAALDTYGQFSTMNRWAPNAVAAPPVDMPAKPGY